MFSPLYQLVHPMLHRNLWAGGKGRMRIEGVAETHIRISKKIILWDLLR